MFYFMMANKKDYTGSLRSIARGFEGKIAQ
jgi:hypothetical protein